MSVERTIPYDGLYHSKDGTKVYELRYSRIGRWYVSEMQQDGSETYLERNIDLDSVVFMGRIKRQCKSCGRFAIFNTGMCKEHELERCAHSWEAKRRNVA